MAGELEGSTWPSFFLQSSNLAILGWVRKLSLKIFGSSGMFLKKEKKKKKKHQSGYKAQLLN